MLLTFYRKSLQPTRNILLQVNFYTYIFSCFIKYKSCYATIKPEIDGKCSSDTYIQYNYGKLLAKMRILSLIYIIIHISFYSQDVELPFSCPLPTINAYHASTSFVHITTSLHGCQSLQLFQLLQHPTDTRRPTRHHTRG